MNRYAIVDAGVVVNVTRAAGPLDPGWIELDAGSVVGPGWLWDGSNFSEPPAPDPVVPQVVSRAQGKAVLIQMGLWSAVLGFVDAIEDPTDKALALVALNDTVEWRRDSVFLATAAAALNISDQQLDAMFIAAAQIVF